MIGNREPRQPSSRVLKFSKSVNSDSMNLGTNGRDHRFGQIRGVFL